jgi:cadmium resistance protein CadD (predicted permease)
MTHVVVTALSGVWPFAVTNVDDFVVLTALFVTVGRGGPSNRQIVVGQYLGIGALVAVSLVVSIGLASIPDRWIGLLGVIPIVLGVRGLVRARTVPSDGKAVAAVTGVIGVVALTLANGADNVSVYIPLFRQAGAGTASVYVLVFAVLVGVWCMAARAVAGQKPLIRMVARVGHWLVPMVYLAIGIRIIVTSGLFGT